MELGPERRVDVELGLIVHQGAAVVSYADDHNDLDGNTFVTRQLDGPGLLASANGAIMTANNSVLASNNIGANASVSGATIALASDEQTKLTFLHEVFSGRRTDVPRTVV